MRTIRHFRETETATERDETVARFVNVMRECFKIANSYKLYFDNLRSLPSHGLNIGGARNMGRPKAVRERVPLSPQAIDVAE